MTDRLRDHGWRLLLVASGVIMLAGGSGHPSSDAKDPLREEFVTMMSDDAWVPAHSLIALSTLLLAAGLVAVRRADRWPASTRSALRLASVAVSLYVVETILHLAAVVDVDRLRDGGFAPVAFTHIALAAVLYPVSGLALANLAARLLPSWSRPMRTFGVAGVVAGLAHAVSVPATLIFDQTELSPLFALASILIAVWSISAGLVGLRSSSDRTAPATEMALVP